MSKSLRQPRAGLGAARPAASTRARSGSTLLSHHYRSDWEWFDDGLTAAQTRLKTWQDAVRSGGPDAEPTVREVLARMADDLDAPGALAAIDAWAESTRPGGRRRRPAT